MDFVNIFLQWMEGIIYEGAKVCSWLTTRLTVPDWLWKFGYVFTPMHFMNVLIDKLAFTPLELLSVTGLTVFVGVAVFKWIIQ